MKLITNLLQFVTFKRKIKQQLQTFFSAKFKALFTFLGGKLTLLFEKNLIYS